MFSSHAFFSERLIARLTDQRVLDPDFAWRAARARQRRDRIAPTGRLNLLAADHPARNVIRVGANPLAMADRRDYLARIVRVLTSEHVDGVMATMDILEDLLSIDAFLREAGSPSLLDNRLLIASLNRGGLAGAAWELDDPVTGASPAICQEWHLDGAKLLLRVDLSDRASLATLQHCARAIDESNARGLPVFLEPLPVVKCDKSYTVVRSAEALARLAGVASALGSSSRHLWLKLPFCEDYRAVAQSTTLPILLLGGESNEDPAPFLDQLSAAMAAGQNVRGALVGRNVLYPGDEDPLAMAEAVGRIVHHRWSIGQALDEMAAHRNRDLDRLSRWL
jgi:DhnA family fructose-bisphosphate aldolase class Ia